MLLRRKRLPFGYQRVVLRFNLRVQPPRVRGEFIKLGLPPLQRHGLLLVHGLLIAQPLVIGLVPFRVLVQQAHVVG